MGLLYPLPISTEESDFVTINDNQVILKSYGLPYIFWLYGLAALVVYVAMMLGISSTINTLVSSEDIVNQVLAISFIVFSISLPITVIGFFFYQKVISINYSDQCLKVTHKIFGLSLKTKTLKFNKEPVLDIHHYLDSPNMARIQHGNEMRGFKNKGYFILEAQDESNKVLIDRSSSKTDLKKIKELLLNHNDNRDLC